MFGERPHWLSSVHEMQEKNKEAQKIRQRKAADCKKNLTCDYQGYCSKCDMVRTCQSEKFLTRQLQYVEAKEAEHWEATLQMARLITDLKEKVYRLETCLRMGCEPTTLARSHVGDPDEGFDDTYEGWHRH